MARPAEDVLEFDKLRELLRLRTTCASGRRCIDALQPNNQRETLQSAFSLIREAREWLRLGRELGFGALADPAGWLQRLDSPGAVLEPADFLDAGSLLETAAWLRQQFREDAPNFPLLAARSASLADFRDLQAAIRRCILPNSEVSDDASSALRRIRASILQTRDSIQKTLKQILRSRHPESGEDYVTLRNDRFVIPVRSEHRRSVQGVVHGSSATGQTVFLEPFETVEMNNQLVQLAEDEAAEIFRILKELTDRLRAMFGPLQSAAATIAELDSVFARGRFARDFDACVPEFSDDPQLRLHGARHPVLEDRLRKENRAIVPMSLGLGGEERLLVISGPNTGGKTVALKTTGLAVLAAQAGIPVAAQQFVVSLFDRVLVDIGDDQSIAADLSTFSSHMLNLKSMLEQATPNSLVLADEMGTGTAPEEGAALAVALLDAFQKKHCFVLATTHHDRLKSYASTTPGVVNAAVEFDDVNLRPTYRLLVGVPGGSSGIAIAKRLALPESIIEHARSLLAPEAQEAADLIAYLHRSRDELDRLRAQIASEQKTLDQERVELRTQWVERQKRRIAELDQKFAEMQKRFEDNVAAIVEAVKQRELRAQIEKTARRKMLEVRGAAKEELNAAVVQTVSESQQDLGLKTQTLQKVNASELQPGARIRVRGFNKPVILRRVDGPSAEIEAGPLRMKVGVDEITAIETEQQRESPLAKRGITVTSQGGDAATSNELNVIGMTVEEATQKVDKFLDDAALANRNQVRIITGHGTGALRKGLGEFLKSHPLVERTQFESEDHGGKAITVVSLRS
ncbi:MAG TPA: endonuclease MutS2 [Candidatus Eremiobacteraceae bacterium]|nr:endonuclease MutS2 [Candidatus Eremiobacteraceae bacterium]